MPADPQLLTFCLAGVVGGLMLFALLLLSGTALVRWLNLPQDLPEAPRFEPPPPPSVLHGDRARAAVTAAAQARLRTLYEQAHAVVRAASQCQDLHQQVRAQGPAVPFAAVSPITEQCSATAVTSATALEHVLASFDRRLRADRTAVTDADLEALRQEIAGHALTTQGALAQARVAVAPLPDGGNRRLFLLVGLLVVMLVWVLAMQYLLKK